jgi:hypothetical protein
MGSQTEDVDLLYIPVHIELSNKTFVTYLHTTIDLNLCRVFVTLTKPWNLLQTKGSRRNTTHTVTSHNLPCNMQGTVLRSSVPCSKLNLLQYANSIMNIGQHVLKWKPRKHGKRVLSCSKRGMLLPPPPPRLFLLRFYRWDNDCCCQGLHRSLLSRLETAIPVVCS